MTDDLCYADMVGMGEYCQNIDNMSVCKSTECWRARIHYARISERNQIMEWLFDEGFTEAADGIDSGYYKENK